MKKQLKLWGQNCEYKRTGCCKTERVKLGKCEKMIIKIVNLKLELKWKIGKNRVAIEN